MVIIPDFLTLSMREMICRMSWSCLRSSPCLKMTGYTFPSSALKISLAGIRALYNTQRYSDEITQTHNGTLPRTHLHYHTASIVYVWPKHCYYTLIQGRGRGGAGIKDEREEKEEAEREEKRRRARKEEEESVCNLPYLLLAVAALSLHGLHQLYQSVHKRLLGGQERPHPPHTLITLEREGEGVK